MADYKIVLADDHAIFRAGLKGLIEKNRAFKVVAEAGNGEALLDILKTIQCDLVVLDLSMPKMDGMRAMETIREKYPKVKILVLTMQKDHEHLKHALLRGALGYVLKEDAYDQLVAAIKAVLKKKRFISPSASEMITDQWIRSGDNHGDPSLEILTQRERQILKLVASGLANKSIASKLKISIRTVETHRAHLTDKLKIKNTVGLVKYALAKGVI